MRGLKSKVAVIAGGGSGIGIGAAAARPAEDAASINSQVISDGGRTVRT